MNKHHFIIIILIASFFTSGCRKYDESENYLRGILDGQPFEATSVSANKPEPIPGSGSDGTLRISGIISFMPLGINLLDEGIIKEGVYEFLPGKERNAVLVESNTVFYYSGNAGLFNSPRLVGSGRITITEISKRYVKGKFELAMVYTPTNSTKKITNGEFSIARK